MGQSFQLGNWKTLENVQILLRPFAEYTQLLTETRKVSLSFVVPAILSLRINLEQVKTPKSLIHSVFIFFFLRDLHLSSFVGFRPSIFSVLIKDERRVKRNTWKKKIKNHLMIGSRRGVTLSQCWLKSAANQRLCCERGHFVRKNRESSWLIEGKMFSHWRRSWRQWWTNLKETSWTLSVSFYTKRYS